MVVYKAKTILKESAPILLLLVVLGTFGGHVLNSQLSSFVKYPLLLLLVPVLNSIAGNVASVLSARLSSRLHTGYIKPKFSGKRLRKNIYATLLLALLVFAFFCLLLIIISFVPSLKVNIPVMKLIIIVMSAGLLITVIALGIAVSSSIISFRKKIDPDNVAIPIATTLVDLVGIGCLVLIIEVVGI